MKKYNEFTLFFSWQSDEKKSQSIIESSLLESVEQLKKEGYKVFIDHSTLNNPGMPDITQTILNKIDNCDIFVADITPIQPSTTNNVNGSSITKERPNPNVLIEMGYAMSALGVDYIIPLAHQGNWKTQDLPFDINHGRIKTFNSTNCDLTTPILDVINHIKKHGRHRHKSAPYFIHKLSVWYYSFIQQINIKKDKQIKLYSFDDSTVFFTKRLASAFPGDRDLVIYNKARDIRKHLKALFIPPLTFSQNGFGSIDPIWWFRAGSAQNIEHFNFLGGRHYIIGWDELIIKRIAVYQETGKYYNNYVYVEAEAQKPTGLYKAPTKEQIIESINEEHDLSEEYALFRYSKFISKKVSKSEEDDGHTKIFGRFIHMKNNQLEIRIRHLTDYNFIICAKGSGYNSKSFDMYSGKKFTALLRGQMSLEQFHSEFMAKFPKNTNVF